MVGMGFVLFYLGGSRSTSWQSKMALCKGCNPQKRCCLEPPSLDYSPSLSLLTARISLKKLDFGTLLSVFCFIDNKKRKNTMAKGVKGFGAKTAHRSKGKSNAILVKIYKPVKGKHSGVKFKTRMVSIEDKSELDKIN